VLCKPEGMGGVNDFTRILADRLFGACCIKNGTRSERRFTSANGAGPRNATVSSRPQATFSRHGKNVRPDKSRLGSARRTKRGAVPEDIGRLAMVQKSPTPSRRR